MITQSGAEYAYFRHAFGPLPAFIFCWVCTLVLKPSQLAIICLAFAKYTVEAFVTECEPPVFIVQLLCAAIIGTQLLPLHSTQASALPQFRYSASALPPSMDCPFLVRLFVFFCSVFDFLKIFTMIFCFFFSNYFKLALNLVGNRC